MAVVELAVLAAVAGSSHGHYVNMSKPGYEQVACGFATGADGKIWSVQNFR